MTERGTDLVDVVLLELPLDLRSRAQEHSDELLREMTLIALQIDEGDGSALPVRLTQLVDQVQATYSAFVDQPDKQIEAAIERGDLVADRVVYTVPRTVGGVATHLMDILEEADEFCRRGEYLLALAAPPDIHAYRIWALREFQTQCEGAAPVPWPTFAAREGVTA